MKKLIGILLIIILISSCSLDNIYQKMGIAKKEELRINSSIVKAEISNGKTDLISNMVGQDLIIQFNINVPTDFTGYVICSQTKEELEDLVLMINAKCYSDGEIDAFLKAPIKYEKSILALKGIAELLESCSDDIVEAIKQLLPKVNIDEDLSEAEKSVREQYNSIVDSINVLSEDLVKTLFEPIIGMLSSDNLTNGDLIKCQLTVNVIDGLLSSINDICTYVIDSTFSNLKREKIDINNKDDVVKLASAIKDELTKTAKVAITKIVDNLLSPIACLDRISFSNEELIGLPSFDSLYNLIKENTK